MTVVARDSSSMARRPCADPSDRAKPRNEERVSGDRSIGSSPLDSQTSAFLQAQTRANSPPTPSILETGEARRARDPLAPEGGPNVTSHFANPLTHSALK
jgi:hypothetical protein